MFQDTNFCVDGVINNKDRIYAPQVDYLIKKLLCRSYVYPYSIQHSVTQMYKNLKQTY